MQKDEKKQMKFTVTEADLAEWQKQFHDLQRQQAELNQRIVAVHQKIQFASMFFAEQQAKEGQQGQPHVVHTTTHFIPPGFINASNIPTTQSVGVQKSPKLSDVVMSFFPTAEDKKTRLEIKKILKNQGYNLGSNDAYFYTLIKRLVEKKQLTKNGDFYSRNIP